EDEDVEVPPIVLEEGRAIEGRVVDESGAPIEGALVDVGGGTAPTDPEDSRLNTSDGAVRTGPDGRFRVPPVSSQPGYLIAQPEHSLSAARPTNAADPVTVTLKSGGRIVGVALDASGARVPVWAFASSGEGFGNGEAQEDGSFIIWRLRPGEYQITVSERGAGTGRHVFRSVKVTVPASGEVRAELQELTTGVDLEVEQRSPGGWVFVSLYPGQLPAPTSAAELRALPSRIESDGPRGSLFRRLEPGAYTLVFLRFEQGQLDRKKVGVLTQAVQVAP